MTRAPNTSPQYSISGLRMKRPIDLAILLVSHVTLMPILLPLWIVIPFLIRIFDGSPIMFKQARVGQAGQLFYMFKFRTMAVDAESTGPGWTNADDTRVTRLGRFLRRTALDELPQLVSILKGDMSFVGPRALPVAMHEACLRDEKDFAMRLVVRPGLTGLSAINLPRHCSPGKRLQLDLAYVHKQSLVLDIRILMVSVWLTITRQWGKGLRSPEADVLDHVR